MWVYAIDYGTSNSLLAAARDGQTLAPLPLDPKAPDTTILRSLIYFKDSRTAFFGHEALKEFVANDLQGRLVRSIKKFLPSRSFSGTVLFDKKVSLETMITRFLSEMRDRANQNVNSDVDAVVLGRPARFSQNDDEDALAEARLRKAAIDAGFKHIEFLAEPVAAALEFKRTLTEPKIVLVADYGGGTSDYSILQLTPAPFQPSDVLAIGGASIAGDALDGAIMRKEIAQYFGARVEYQVPFGKNTLKMPGALMEQLCSPADLSMLRARDTMEFFRNVEQWSLNDADSNSMQRLFTLIEDNIGFSVFEEIERTKRTLSEKDRAQFDFNYPTVEISHEITRKRFDQDIADPVEEIVKALDETLTRAQITPAQVDLVCCTGGTAKVPRVRQALLDRFGAEKLQNRETFHSVVQGLSERAREIS